MRPVISAIFLLATGLSFAGSTSWSYSDYSNGSYVPKTGSFDDGNSTSSSSPKNVYWSRITFKLDASNVLSIKDYNDGGYSGCTANAYLTLDQAADPDSWDLEIDGYTVYSTLPNPKTDIEDNSFFGDNDETEVTALGTVKSGTTYYMTSYWGDERDGGTSDSGLIKGQFAMSQKGWFDYNNCMQAASVQIENSYGDNLGDK